MFIIEIKDVHKAIDYEDYGTLKFIFSTYLSASQFLLEENFVVEGMSAYSPNSDSPDCLFIKYWEEENYTEAVIKEMFIIQ